MAFGYFTPYVESRAAPIRSLTSTQSSSNTTAIDHVRQGVEVVTDAQRYAGVLPKLWSGDSQHQIEITVFGQSSEFTLDSKYEDVARFNPVSYLNSSRSLIYPVVLDNPSFEDPEMLGGYIQPLSIAARDLLTTNAEFEPHDVRSQLMDGNESSFKSVSRITRFFDPKEQQSAHNAFLDVVSDVGGLTGSLRLDGIFPVFESTIRPFNETQALSRSFISGSITGSIAYNIVVALVSMSSDSEYYVPVGHKTCGTGFTYDSAVVGFDSIAFGGLKR